MRRALCLLSVFAVLFLAATAFAVPNADEFKKAKKSRDIKLKDCPLVGNFTTISVTNNGRRLALPDKAFRESYKLDKQYKFFACGLNDQEDTVVFAKETEEGEIIEINPALSDFPKIDDTYGCTSLQRWPGSHIYKRIGSTHFTDVRRNTIGVILKIGAGGPKPSCLIARDAEGNVVAKLGLYATGAGWAARYYAGVGCGAGTPYDGGDVARKAQQKTGSTNIAIQFDRVCYGPINPNVCINSIGC